MPKIRSITDAEKQTLKRVADAAYGLAGGVSLFSGQTRVGISQLSKYASDDPDNVDSFMPIDIAIEADRAAKDPVILREMARMQGYGLVAEGADGRARGEITERHVLSLHSEIHDVHRAIMEARADGKIDGLDRKRIAKEVREAMRELQDILDMVGPDMVGDV